MRRFPCGADKRPLIRDWPSRATADRRQLLEWWSRWPDALVGAPTGAANDFDVLDVDPRHGGSEWLAQHPLRAWRVQTRSGGWHFYFMHHDGVRNSSGKIAPGVDVRGDGGYVIAWGMHGYPESRIDNIGPWPERDLVRWPDWLLEVLLPKPKEERARVGGAGEIACASRYATGALRSACRRVAEAPCGQQECTLNSEALSIGRLVKKGVIDRGLAMETLVTAGAGMTNWRPRDPWTERTVREKVRRAFRDAGAA